MKLIKNSLAVVAVATLAFAGCNKDNTQKQAEPEATEEPEAPEAPEEEPEAPPEQPTAGTVEGQVVVEATHTPGKPDDPVQVKFDDIRMVSAEFDPQNLEGGSAEFAVGLASLSSGIPSRDQHLNSADFLNTAEQSDANVKVRDVKKAGDKYTAKMEVSAHGETQSWDIQFSAKDATENSVTIVFEQPFTRDMFKIGDAGGKVGKELKVKTELKLTKS